VFAPAVLTILGAILYLREGWVVGNAGLGGALAIIGLAHVITISTALSVSSIATNIRVGAGGAYAIITQSLGLEAGGSIGIPLYVARTVSAVLYVLALAEGWSWLFPGHSSVIVSLVGFVVVFGISYISTRFAQRAQVLIMVVVFLSLVSVFLGAIPIGEGRSLFGVLDFKAQAGASLPIEWWGAFAEAGFWETFAIFFPAVTGIVAGISLSDVLAEPRRSIPHGTLWAVGITLVIYVALAYWLARVASPQELVSNMLIMVDKALIGWAVLIGLLGATFSSALGSLVAAPRVLQALGVHRVVPFGESVAEVSKDGEPRRAMLVTGALTLVVLVIALLGGGLNFVAPLITMFFLLTYAMLNLVVLVEQTLDMVSFRPTFRVPRVVPLVGFLSSGFVMFLINPIFSLFAVLLPIGVYAYLAKQKLPVTAEGDVRSGAFLALAEWAAGMVSAIPAAPERTWQPNVLVPVRSTGELRGSYRLLRALARHGGVRALGIYPPGGRAHVEKLSLLARDFERDGLFARATLLEQAEFVPGSRAAIELLRSTYFPPNILFLRLLSNGSLGDMRVLMEQATEQGMGVAVLLEHPVVELGQEQRINVWMRDQGPDWELSLRLGNDLSLLLAYELAQSWNGEICLCMAVEDGSVQRQAETYLKLLIELGRLERWAKSAVFVGGFGLALQSAPSADLTILGLSSDPDVDKMRWVMERVDGSCLLVRDSGNESVLA
jgi:amino acid transporter